MLPDVGFGSENARYPNGAQMIEGLGG